MWIIQRIQQTAQAEYHQFQWPSKLPHYTDVNKRQLSPRPKAEEPHERNARTNYRLFGNVCRTTSFPSSSLPDVGRQEAATKATFLRFSSVFASMTCPSSWARPLSAMSLELFVSSWCTEPALWDVKCRWITQRRPRADDAMALRRAV